MSNIYNPLKLSVYRESFHPKKVLVIGSGAVGTALMEFLVKMGVSADAVDFDYFTMENAAKHSCLVRTPEDVNRNKAECVSARVQPLLDDGCSSNGINSDLCKLGPEAFADYDVVVASVDNYDAKILLNELIRELPKKRRPVIIMDGTYDEMATSVMLDGSEFCLRCLIDDTIMKDSGVRNSCVGPQWRQLDGEPEIVRTSNLASSMAAHLSAEQFRAYVIGEMNAMNRRLTYTAYPNLELSSSMPSRKTNCSGCKIVPPNQIEWLRGTVLETTLEDVMPMISENLGTADFEIIPHRLNYRKTIYTKFIVDDVCHSCGKSISVMQHEGRLFLNDLLCDTCREEGRVARDDPATFSVGTELLAFTEKSPESVKKMTLFQLGYPLGAHIQVLQRKGDFDYFYTVFSFDSDHEQMHFIKKL